MSILALTPCRDIRTSCSENSRIFPHAPPALSRLPPALSRLPPALSRLPSPSLLGFVPLMGEHSLLPLQLSLGHFEITTLGFNILVGFNDRISIGHAAI